MLRIHVALLPDQIHLHNDQTVAAAVVIDTLRFTTTACQALSAGAREILVASEIDEARQLKARALSDQNQPPLLCGERECRPIEGFDLGNSPYEYTDDQIGNRQLVFTTTNGTKAIAATKKISTPASTIYLGALVNRKALCRDLSNHDGDLWLVCAGTDGRVAAEDVLAAGAIIDGLSQAERVGDAALLAEQLSRQVLAEDESTRESIIALFRSASGGANLIETGYSRDLEFAAQLDSLSVVPKQRVDGVFVSEG